MTQTKKKGESSKSAARKRVSKPQTEAQQIGNEAVLYQNTKFEDERIDRKVKEIEASEAAVAADQAEDNRKEAATKAIEEGKPVKAAKVLPTLDEALESARAGNPNRYINVLEVTELTKDGAPKRVTIRCSDPQYKTMPDQTKVSVCEGTRNIAVQDLFQVECCAACADRKVRKARRNRAKARDKSLRKAIAAAKGH